MNVKLRALVSEEKDLKGLVARSSPSCIPEDKEMALAFCFS